MIVITITPIKAELIDFSVKEETAEMQVTFRDESDEHVFSIKNRVADTEELAEKVVLEMRKIVKKFHTPETDQYEEILAIRVHDEETVIKRLKLFFDKVKEKIKEVRMTKSANGYLDTLSRAKKLELYF